MPGGLITIKNNEKLKNDGVLDKNGVPIKISKSHVNRILKNIYSPPIKVKKFFYLSKENKEKIVNFCKEILEMGLKGKDIFFTDETKIDTSTMIINQTLYKNERKIKKGDKEAFKLVIREKKV